MTKEVEGIDIQKAIPDFEARFPMEMSILRLGGVYPREKATLAENPYTGEEESEYFGNIGEHCVAVAFAAEAIAKKVLGDSDSRVKIVTGRALIHDATKRYEIMRKKALKKGLIEDAYSPNANETIIPILEREGLPKDIISYMANAGAETGSLSFHKFLVFENGRPMLNPNVTLEEMIVHLADDMTHTPIVGEGEEANTSYLTGPQRMEASDFPNRYPFLYSEGIGFDAQGKPVPARDIDEANEVGVSHFRTLAFWQAWIDGQIAKSLVERIDTGSLVQDPENFVLDIVNSSTHESTSQ